MAWQVLIVDDLPIIVDTLAEMMERWELEEFEVQRAYSGEEALLKLNAKTDIVITDIQMPEMDGIDLLELIRWQWPRCKVIFLTGYDLFEYAQKALTLGAFDYVLKADGSQKVFEVVERAVSLLVQENDDRKTMARAEQQYRLSLPSMRKEFIWDLMNGGNARAEQWMLDHLDTSLVEELPILLLIGRIDPYSVNLNMADHKQLLLDIQSSIEEKLPTPIHFLHAEYERSEFVWLFQPNTTDKAAGKFSELSIADWEEAVRMVQEAGLLVKEEYRQRNNLKLSFAASQESIDWRQLPKAFHSMRMALAYGERAEEISVHVGSHKVFKQDRAFYTARLEQLQKCFENNHKHDFFFEYDELVHSVWRKADTAINLELNYSLASMLLSQLNRLDIPEDIHRGVYEQFQSAADRLRAFDENTAKFYRDMASFIFEWKSNAQEEPGTHIVQLVHKYVEANIHRYFSLSEVADHVHLNRTYLSRLYKQLTGEGLYEYVNRMKLEQAIDKLIHTNMKIQDIAISLGYLSAMSFIRFFKAQKGVSPQEYRESKK